MGGLSRGAIWGAGVGIVLSLLAATDNLGPLGTPVLIVVIVPMLLGGLILGTPGSMSAAGGIVSGVEIFGYVALVATGMVVGSILESVRQGARWTDVPRYMQILLLSFLGLLVYMFLLREALITLSSM